MLRWLYLSWIIILIGRMTGNCRFYQAVHIRIKFNGSFNEDTFVWNLNTATLSIFSMLIGSFLILQKTSLLSKEFLIRWWDQWKNPHTQCVSQGNQNPIIILIKFCLFFWDDRCGHLLENFILTDVLIHRITVLMKHKNLVLINLQCFCEFGCGKVIE